MSIHCAKNSLRQSNVDPGGLISEFTHVDVYYRPGPTAIATLATQLLDGGRIRLANRPPSGAAGLWHSVRLGGFRFRFYRVQMCIRLVFAGFLRVTLERLALRQSDFCIPFRLSNRRVCYGTDTLVSHLG